MRKTVRIVAALVLAVTMILPAAQPITAQAARITVSGKKTLHKGVHTRLRVYKGNQRIPSRLLKFSSSNTKALSVSKSGLVTARGNGRATITIKYKTAKCRYRMRSIYTKKMKKIVVTARNRWVRNDNLKCNSQYIGRFIRLHMSKCDVRVPQAATINDMYNAFVEENEWYKARGEKCHLIGKSYSNIPWGSIVFGTGNGGYGWAGIYVGHSEIIDLQGTDVFISTKNDWVSWQQFYGWVLPRGAR